MEPWAADGKVPLGEVVLYLGGACRMFKIKTKSDPEYQDLVDHFRSGGGRDLLVDKTFYAIWDEVSMEDGILFYDSKLLVTKKLIPFILRRLHLQHQGRDKTYALAKQLFYFKNMKQLIQDMIRCCKVCARYRALPQRELMKHEYAVRPFQQLTMDIFQCGGQLYLAASDR